MMVTMACLSACRFRYGLVRVAGLARVTQGPVASAANKKAASGLGRLGFVLSINMTGQGRAKRAHHQLPLLFIEIVMGAIVSVSRLPAQANFSRAMRPKREMSVNGPTGWNTRL
jgi:hypothetical protein